MAKYKLTQNGSKSTETDRKQLATFQTEYWTHDMLRLVHTKTRPRRGVEGDWIRMRVSTEVHGTCDKCNRSFKRNTEGVMGLTCPYCYSLIGRGVRRGERKDNRKHAV